jgi:hypothetical protein
MISYQDAMDPGFVRENVWSFEASILRLGHHLSTYTKKVPSLRLSTIDNDP